MRQKQPNKQKFKQNIVTCAVHISIISNGATYSKVEQVKLSCIMCCNIILNGICPVEYKTRTLQKKRSQSELHVNQKSSISSTSMASPLVTFLSKVSLRHWTLGRG